MALFCNFEHVFSIFYKTIKQNILYFMHTLFRYKQSPYLRVVIALLTGNVAKYFFMDSHFR